MGVEDHRGPGTHGPAAPMLSESGVSCLRAEGRGARGDPQPGGAALPLQAVSAAVAATLCATRGTATAVLNTASIERLNAAFRARLASLTRRTRAGVHHRDTLEAGRWLVGTAYTFCHPHRTLRRHHHADDPPARRWIGRTPAQAAGLADHPRSAHELLTFPVPGVGIKKRGALPKWLRQAARVA